MNNEDFDTQANLMRGYAERWRSGSEKYRTYCDETVDLLTEFIVPEEEREALRDIYRAFKEVDTDV